MVRQALGIDWFARPQVLVHFYCGLLKVKLNTLLKVPAIDSIVVSTNDTEVINIAKSFKNEKIVIDIRPW